MLFTSTHWGREIATGTNIAETHNQCACLMVALMHMRSVSTKTRLRAMVRDMVDGACGS